MYCKREAARLVSKALGSLPVVVVTGIRQVGKTTMLLEEPDLSGREYHTLEDHADYETGRRNPEDLLERPVSLTVDEVQQLPALLPAIKAAVDRRRYPGRFLLSGSSSLLLLSSVTESLAGRALYVELMPMTRRELREETSAPPFVVKLLEEAKPAPAPFSPVLPQECLLGGLPPVAVHKADGALWFRGFEQTYLERDVRSLAQVGDLAAFRQVFRMLAARPGAILNLSEVARESALSLDTVRRYVSVLEASFSIFRLPPWRKGRTARLVKAPKIYAVDSGFAAWLNGLHDPANAGIARSWGAILDTYVLQNLRAILAAWMPDAGIFYWREHGRYEVDFVIEHHDRVVPLEVKWTSRWTDADLAGLRRFMALHPQCPVGLLACRTSTLSSLGNGIYAVPLGQLLA